MSHDIDDSAFRVLDPNGNTVRTGFLVSQNLAVTCALVVEGAKATKRNTIHV